MPIPGQTKQEFCPVCGHETRWEYIAVQLPDGVFGIQNLIEPDVHRIRLWRCCEHTEPDGRMKAEFKRHKHTPASV